MDTKSPAECPGAGRRAPEEGGDSHTAISNAKDPSPPGLAGSGAEVPLAPPVSGLSLGTQRAPTPVPKHRCWVPLAWPEQGTARL